MPKRLLELTATVTYELFRFGQSEPFTVILEAVDDKGERIVLKGLLEENDPQQHLTYRFYGSWASYKNQRTGQSEPQFRFQTFVRATPHSRAGIVKYLSNAPNIGRVLAGRLFEKFQGDAVKILREKPEVAAAAIERLSEEAALEAAEWLEREKSLEDCTIALVDLLEGHGLPKSLVKQAVKEWGNRATDVIRQDPYRMMRFRGVGFKRCDALYLDLNKPPGRLKRQALCAWYHVASNSNGDTWFPKSFVHVGLAGAIAGADVRAEQATDLAGRSGMLTTIRTDGPNGAPDWDGSFEWMAEGAKGRNEARLAGYICEALEEK